MHLPESTVYCFCFMVKMFCSLTPLPEKNFHLIVTEKLFVVMSDLQKQQNLHRKTKAIYVIRMIRILECYNHYLAAMIAKHLTRRVGS